MCAVRSIAVSTILALMFAGRCVFSAPRVCLWPRNAQTAVSFTYDDSKHEHYRYIGPELEKRGFRATFFVVPRWISSEEKWEGFRGLVRSGHEIGNHTDAHRAFTTLTPELIEADVVEGIEYITANLGVYPATFAYPYCKVGEGAPIVGKYHIAARGGCGKYTADAEPQDMMSLKAYNYDDFNLSEANNAVESAMINEQWVVQLAHSYGSMDELPTSRSRDFEKHLDFLKGKGESVWVATFGDAARYIHQRRAVVMAVDSTEASSWRLRLTDTLADTMFNMALTVALPVPFTVESVTQQAQPLWWKQKGDTLYVEAFVDKEDVLVRNSATYTRPLVVNNSHRAVAGKQPLRFNVQGQLITGRIFAAGRTIYHHPVKATATCRVIKAH